MKTPAFIFGTQYFRPPFPRREHWEDDLGRMADAGLNAVQLWLVWGWCEPEPGRLVFDDYDELADLAGKRGLGVVLSVLPEINPFWMPRLIPDGLMIDLEGRQVHNCNRTECISGLVPGLCGDHPAVRARMTGFMEACGKHFGRRDNLLAWDSWNENRWRNAAPDFVCFCPHSLADFRRFLEGQYGTLDALGRAWGRRYSDWADVRIGRLLGNSYPEMHDFTRWTCDRAARMAAWRVQTLRQADPHHPIGSHTGNPSVFGGISINENLFSRGIDWDVAAGDSYGLSSFPSMTRPGMNPEELCCRMGSLATASARGPIWMSELQGGPVSMDGVLGPPLPGAEQQAWIWTGIARGCKACIFWCWRNEVFGGETNGFGVLSPDGLAPDRLAAIARSQEVLRLHAQAVASYTPAPPEVGLLFQRDSYFYDWIGSKGLSRSNYEAPSRFLAWAYALERIHAPYLIHDDRHMPPSGHGLKLMIVPESEGLDDAAADWLISFAQAGGTVLVEGVAGARGADTYLREPGRRPLCARLGLTEALHRSLTQPLRVIPAGALGNPRPIKLAFENFEATYAGAGGVNLSPDQLPVLANVAIGRGRVICLGGLVGRATTRSLPGELEELLARVMTLAGVEQPVRLAQVEGGFCNMSLGVAGASRLLFLVNFSAPSRVTLEFTKYASPAPGSATEWFGHRFELLQAGDGARIKLELEPFEKVVLEWPDPSPSREKLNPRSG